MGRHYYSMESNQPYTVRSTTKLLNIATCRYDGDWHSVLHTHKHTELFFIIDGKGQFLIQDQVFPVEANSMIIINPNILHTETSLNAQPLEYIVFGISGIELAINEDFTSPFSIVNNLESKEITSCLQNILREIELKHTGFQDICQAYAEILIVQLMRNASVSIPVDPQAISNNRQCAAVKRYIDIHFKEPLTLEILAREAHMNKYYLSHTFKREYSVSPIHYMISRRIDESKYLLAETDLSMSQIAQILGFSSLSYFSQVFRKTQKISPMEFRQNSKNL